MLIKVWRFAAIVLTAFTMALALCHWMEMPGKLATSGRLWLRIQHTLYPPTFGSIGAVFEVGALITVTALVVLVRRRGLAFAWTMAAAACLNIAHAAYWVWVEPVNVTIGRLTPDTLPENWEALREQWEYGHVARAVLQIGAFATLLVSILRETPGTQTGPARASGVTDRPTSARTV